ncbi:MAG TPA: hypothetical protein VFE18_15825, partial [Phenylobacterium sp.]|uniref:hypothetical protein n=1 Tax=Phenylobacterium sp. TaxID=1871053 RepID=UPI002D25A98C
SGRTTSASTSAAASSARVSPERLRGAATACAHRRERDGRLHRRGGRGLPLAGGREPDAFARIYDWLDGTLA